MIPAVSDILSQDIEVTSYPSKTYKLNIEAETISGTADGIEAVKQAVYKILSTERYEYIAYSWNYGLYTLDLIGEDPDYVCAELERRISEALTADDRIESVDNYEFDVQENKVKCSFVVNSTYGTISAEKVVDV